MNRTLALGTVSLVTALAFAAPGPAPDGAKFWPQWRGPLASGAAPAGDPPVQWSESQNIKWKLAIPGLGSSTPIVWGDRIYVLTAISTDKPAPAAAAAEPPAGSGPRRGPRGVTPTHIQQFAVLAISRKDGKILWQRVVREALPHEGHHPTNTWASHSAVTDGERIYAYFGSNGLYCLDMNGSVKWEKDFGDMTTRNGFGEGASPALASGKLVVIWDHEGEDFIVALDSKTGKELWRTAREEPTSWSTPLVVEHAGKKQIFTSATNRVRSYDLETGKLLWEGPGLTPNAIPSPVAGDGMVYATSGFRGNALLAIRLAAAQGDISASADAIAWKYDRDTPYVPSPLLYDGQIYILKSNNGILTTFDAKTGEKIYGEQRIEAVPNVYASPVGAAGRVYIAGREGSVAVIQHGRDFKLLAANKLDDGFDASPVVVDKELYLRGRKSLYCIAEK